MKEDKIAFHNDGCDYRIDHEGRCVGCHATAIDAQSTKLARQCETAHATTASRCQRPAKHDGPHSAVVANSLQSWSEGSVTRDHSQNVLQRLGGTMKFAKTPPELWTDAERDQRSYPRGDFKSVEERFVSYMITHGYLPAPMQSLVDQLAVAWAEWVSARDHGDGLGKRNALTSLIDAASNLRAKL